MITGFDHVVLVTPDLPGCSERFRSAGFTVTLREDLGEHVADHRLVCFGDGSYLELFTLDPREPSARDHRWYPYTEAGEGFCDYSLTTTGLDGLASGAEAAGIPHTAVREGGKVRADGQEWRLRLSMFGLGVTTPAMPFVIEDVSERSVRVCGSTQHPNGADGISAVTVVTSEDASSHSGLTYLTGCARPMQTDREDGVSQVYPFGSRRIELLVPRPQTAAWERMRRVGTVVYEIEIASGGDSCCVIRTGSSGAMVFNSK